MQDIKLTIKQSLGHFNKVSNFAAKHERVLTTTHLAHRLKHDFFLYETVVNSNWAHIKQYDIKCSDCIIYFLFICSNANGRTKVIFQNHSVDLTGNLKIFTIYFQRCVPWCVSDDCICAPHIFQQFNLICSNAPLRSKLKQWGSIHNQQFIASLMIVWLKLQSDGDQITWSQS